MKKGIYLAVATFMTVVLSGCGTIFWSERKGKTSSDKIDAAVLILDCCGLLLGIIPGVVALILDFNNKTIYFSADEIAGVSTESGDMVAIKVESMDRASIEAAVSEYVGYTVTLEELNLAAVN